MNRHDDKPDSHDRNRLVAVLESVTARRLAGESITDDEITAQHPELMPQLGVMLRNMGRVEQARVSGSSTTIPNLADERPARIAADSFTGYKVVGEIHRGGQGVVYQATQEATRRSVAIKVLREGLFSSAQDRARFEREIQILGQLKHPNIVTIHETGSTAGHDFFVMDYVPGKPLDQHVLDEKLPVRDVLALFARICDAVNVAHLRGVIHRDLKPGNIRVDPSGMPHILDFGLAKVADYDVIAESRTDLRTMTGQFVGSLPWASPEQVGEGADRVDIRSDVYSIGVTLYQVLTGRFPYEVFGNIRDVLDRICNATPPRPSLVRSEIDDDVDTLVLRCLSKERDRRYQGAGELAAEIRRYLTGEPLEARRDSSWYVLKKTVRRHRFAAGSILLIMLLLGIGSAWLTVLYASESRERLRAETAEQSATEEATRARAEARKAQRINSFLQDLLASGDPFRTQSTDMTVAEVLDHAAGRIAADLGDEPQIKIAVHNTIGTAYLSLGEFEKAEHHFKAAFALDSTAASTSHNLGVLSKARGDFQQADQLLTGVLAKRAASLPRDDRTYAETLHALADLKHQRGDHDAADRLLRELVELRRNMLGSEHPETASALSSLARLRKSQGQFDEAETLYLEALSVEAKYFGEDHLRVAGILNNLAVLSEEQGGGEEAEAYYRRALKISAGALGAEHPRVIRIKSNLAVSLYDQGRLPEAESLHREALASRRSRLGDRHPDVADSLNNLGAVLMARGHRDEAASLWQKAYAILQAHFDDSHPTVVSLRNNLASVLYLQGDYAAAVPLYRVLLEEMRQRYAGDHPHVAGALSNYAMALFHSGDHATAEPILGEAVSMLQRVAGPNHALIPSLLQNRASILAATGRLGEAEKLYRRIVKLSEDRQGPDHPNTLRAVRGLASFLAQWKRSFAEAEPLFRLVAEARRAASPQDGGVYGVDLCNLAHTVHGLGRLEHALRIYEEAADVLREGLSAKHVYFAWVQVGTAAVQLDLKNTDAAERLCREGLSILKSELPADHWQVAFAGSVLGSCLASRGEWEAGSALLHEGVRILEAAKGANHGRAVEAKQRLAQLQELMSSDEAVP